MYDKKVPILVLGCSRGGTNLLWNIIQSHPQIVSPKYEINQLLNQNFDQSKFLYYCFKLSYSFGINFTFLKKILNSRVNQSINENYINNSFNYLSQKIPILKNQRIVYKLVYGPTKNLFWKYAKTLGEFNIIKMLDSNLNIIVIKKKPSSQILSWYSRGFDLNECKRRYKQFLLNIEYLKVKYKNQIFEIKFEDLIRNPFAISKILFEDLRLFPSDLEDIRIKLKSNASNQYKKERKLWVNKKNFKDYIKSNTDINYHNLISEDELDNLFYLDSTYD